MRRRDAKSYASYLKWFVDDHLVKGTFLAAHGDRKLAVELLEEALAKVRTAGG